MMVKIALSILKYIFLVKFTKAELTGSIVGGGFAEIKDFPHSVCLATQKRDGPFMCSASILTQALVLTAAHCVDSCQGGSCKIMAFTGSIRVFGGSPNKIISFKIHENFDNNTFDNDIALLRLQTNLTLGKVVKKIIIMKNPPKHKTARVAGWGRVNHSAGSNSLVLKHTTQQIMDRKTCNALINIVPNGAFCGRQRSYPESGDSGSALVIEKRTIQIGIASIKNRFRSNETLVYTDVAYHYNWIVQNAPDLYCKEEN